MKICYLVESQDSSSGGGRYASDLISGIKKSGVSVVIVKEIDDGGEGVILIKRGFGMFGSAVRLCELAKDCDIIHALDVYPCGIIAWMANIFLKKNLVITAIGTYSVAPFYNLKTRWLSKRAIRASHVVTVISRYTKNEILKITNNKNITVINPGIDFLNFYQKHFISEDRFVLSVGALKKRKGYHISIPAFAKANVPGLKYMIVGNQNNRAYLLELIGIAKRYGVEERVIFLQNVSDVELKELYGKAQLFILTSINSEHHFEGFGLVFLEAAASGLPVIGTLGNGTEDAIGKNGILVEQNNITNTSDVIREILENKNKWQKMSDYSYEWARAHDLHTMIDEYLNIYGKIL